MPPNKEEQAAFDRFVGDQDSSSDEDDFESWAARQDAGID